MKILLLISPILLVQHKLQLKQEAFMQKTGCCSKETTGEDYCKAEDEDKTFGCL